MNGDDASFADGDEAPLRLRALDAGDLEVISGLCQDAVFSVSDMAFDRRARRFAVLLNRYRWERGTRAPERVRAMLVVEDATRVQTLGLPRGDVAGNAETVLSLLSLAFKPGEDGTGQLELTLAGDGAVAVAVEALEVVLRDVTRPYVAPSGKTPAHPD